MRTATSTGSSSSRTGVRGYFEQWLLCKTQKESFDSRQIILRDRLLARIERSGDKDDKGSQFLELDQPVVYRTKGSDGKPKVLTYRSLKRERHLVPALPTADAELAEELLRKKKLWLTKEQQEAINTIQDACPYVSISIEVDPNEFYNAYIRNRISEAEYTSCLIEQREQWHFKPCE